MGNSKSSHVLLQNAKRFPKKLNQGRLSDFNYDHHDGFWKAINGGVAMIHFQDVVKSCTKKCDVETGEDRKGE